MEKVLSVDERIRRAEERYYQTKNKEQVQIQEKPKSKKVQKKIIYKFIKNTVICLITYSIFYTIINNNYIFSEDFTNKAKEILDKDINLFEIYFNIKDKFNNYIQDNNETENTSTNIEQETDIQNEQEELSQTEKDINFIKSNVSLIKPVEGTISSKYGLRNPTTETVPKNHTGVDIAATVGTKIVSSTDGKVILNSSEGDYGNHIQIQTGEVIIVYAHCNKIYVNEGDEVKQGQEIAEVGNTGNTTGPHLHFEIRYQNRYIDPEMVLDLS